MLPVFAHIVSTGVGPFDDGVAHFLVSIEEILPVIAMVFSPGCAAPEPDAG
jgi:hypothetical protein